MNKLIFKFLTDKRKYSFDKGAVNKHSKNFFYKIINSKFAESTENLTSTEKMKKILEKEAKMEKGSEEEIKFIQNKKIPLVRHQNLIRSPIYISLPFLLWLSPFSTAYSFTLLFSNYYLLFLTSFEATAFFSLGLNKYNLILTDSKLEAKEAVEVRERTTRKRLAIMFIFFIFLCFSSILASQYNNSFSMVGIFLSNLYLYAKFSLHITLHGLNKRVFERRMKNVGMNILLAVLLGFIYSRNDKYINNNIKYNI